MSTFIQIAASKKRIARKSFFAENHLDKSHLKRSCLKIMQRSMDLRIVSTLLMTAGLAQTLTALIGNA